MKPITPRMLKTLSELAEQGSFARYMPYAGRFNPSAYYFMHGTLEKCTSQIRGLLERGLAEMFDDDGFGRCKVRISRKGRKYLKENA